MSYTKIANPLILGSELLTNGMFSGNANSWTLGSNWAYSSANVLHTSGATADLKQSGLSIADGASYRVVFSVSGTTGTVTVKISANAPLAKAYRVTVNAGSGVNSITLLVSSNNDGILYFTPSSGFDGAISSVGLRKLNEVYTKVGTETY